MMGMVIIIRWKWNPVHGEEVGAYDLAREEEDGEEGGAHDDRLPLPLHASIVGVSVTGNSIADADRIAALSLPAPAGDDRAQSSTGTHVPRRGG
jgi:hypothetical protein